MIISRRNARFEQVVESLRTVMSEEDWVETECMINEAIQAEEQSLVVGKLAPSRDVARQFLAESFGLVN